MEITRSTKIEDLPELMTLEEFRGFLGIGRSLVYDLARRQEIPIVRYGRKIFVVTKKAFSEAG